MSFNFKLINLVASMENKMFQGFGEEEKFFGFFVLKMLTQYNTLFLFIVTSVLILLYFCLSNSYLFNTNLCSLVLSGIKYVLISSLFISFFLHCVTAIIYFNYILCWNSMLFDNSALYYPSLISSIGFKSLKVNLTPFTQFSLSFDLFGILLLFLAYIVGIISLFTLDSRLFWGNAKYMFVFNIFIIIVFLYTVVDNIIIFFFMYECLLLPSFLFVYFVSPSRRAIQASIYFVIWTQIGSFLVLCSIMYIISVSGCYTFSGCRLYNFTNYETLLIYILLFLGFGVKVPIWPFHY